MTKDFTVDLVIAREIEEILSSKDQTERQMIMSAAADAIAAATTDAANVAADQTKLAADQATEATDDISAFAALSAAPYNGTGLYIATASDGTLSYYVATAAPPSSFTLTPIPVL